MPDLGMRTWQAAKARAPNSTPQPWLSGPVPPCRHHVNARQYSKQSFRRCRTASLDTSRSQSYRNAPSSQSRLSLSQQAKASNDIQELHQLLLSELAGSKQAGSSSIDAIDIAAAASRLGQLSRRHNSGAVRTQDLNALLQCLVVVATATHSLLPTFRPRELANVLWCIAVTVDTLRTAGVHHVEDSVIVDVVHTTINGENTNAAQLPLSISTKLKISENSSTKPDAPAYQQADDASAGKQVWTAVWTESTLQPSAPSLQHDSAMNPTLLHQYPVPQATSHYAADASGKLGTSPAQTTSQQGSQFGLSSSSMSIECMFWQGFEKFCQPVTAEAASGRDIAQVIYAVAVSKLTLTAQQANLVQQLLSMMQPERRHLNAQDISMTVWAVASLGIKPPATWLKAIQNASVPLLPKDFTPQGFSNMAWGMAVLGCPVTSPWLAELLACSSPLLHTFTNQELANLAWAVPTLANAEQRHRYAKWWLVSIDMELALRLQNTTQTSNSFLNRPTVDTAKSITSIDAGQQAGSFEEKHQALQFLNQSQWDATIAHGQTHANLNNPSQQKGGGSAPLLPQDVACILRCLALMNHQASSMLLFALESHILSTLAAHRQLQHKQQAGTVSISSQLAILGEIWATDRQAQCTVLWSLARMGVTPSVELVKALVQRLGAQLHACNEQDLSSCLYALALLKHNPDGKWLVRFFEASRNLMKYCKPAQLSALLLGLARLRVRPDKSWMEHALCQVTAQMQKYLASKAAAPFSAVHDNAVCQQLDPSSMMCNTRDVSSLWGALGRMAYCPPEPCIAPLLAVSETLLPEFNPQELAMMVTAQAKLGLKFEGGSSKRKSRNKGSNDSATEFSGEMEVPRLPESWAVAVCSVTARHAAVMTPHDLHAVLRALSQMNALQGFKGRTGLSDSDRTATTQCLTVSGDHLVYHSLLTTIADQQNIMPDHLEAAYGLASLNLLAPKWLVSLRLQGLKVREELFQEYNTSEAD